MHILLFQFKIYISKSSFMLVLFGKSIVLKLSFLCNINIKFQSSQFHVNNYRRLFIYKTKYLMLFEVDIQTHFFQDAVFKRLSFVLHWKVCCTSMWCKLSLHVRIVVSPLSLFYVQLISFSLSKRLYGSLSAPVLLLYMTKLIIFPFFLVLVLSVDDTVLKCKSKQVREPN